MNSRPFLLKPAGKNYLWGGRRLKDDFSKDLDMEPLAETWECSTHPDGPSVAASGEFEGETLTEVLKAHPEYLGTRADTRGGLPILIKLIDAKHDLSVQVHPNDAYATEHENGSCGKTELWVVLDAPEGSYVVHGFAHDMDRETLRKSIADGTLEEHLRKVPIKKGDVFFIEAGTVHAIGAGALIAEIQESSNVTYRLYDYNRRDKNGNTRELHIEKALDVADLKAGKEAAKPAGERKISRGFTCELLCRCPYFEVERLQISTERCREMADFKAENDSFTVLLCTEGCGVLLDARNPEKDALPFFRGDCIFVPAGSVPVKIHGQAELLKVTC